MPDRPRPRAAFLRRSLVRWRTWTDNLGAKILSFVVAVGLWYSVTNRLEFEDTVDFPWST